MATSPEQRALAKAIKEAARSADDLAGLRKVVVVLPMDIEIQLNNAIEEVDLLIHLLHERTLLHVIATADELAAAVKAGR